MDVRKTLTDTGYVAVGLGVLGVQQVATLTRNVGNEVNERVSGCDLAALREKLDETRSSVGQSIDARASRVGDQIGELRGKVQIDALRDKVSEQAKQSAERAGAFTDDLKGRVEPVIERAKSLVGSAA